MKEVANELDPGGHAGLAEIGRCLFFFFFFFFFAEEGCRGEKVGT